MTLAYTVCETSIGPVHVAWTDRGIVFLSSGIDSEETLRQKLRPYSASLPVRDQGRQAELTALLEGWLSGAPYEGPIDLRALSSFARAVLEETRRIPRGEVRTYGWLAARVGRPGAARAVGTAMRRNPVPLLIPCHRVVRETGELGNYSMGGPAVKERLLAMEGAR